MVPLASGVAISESNTEGTPLAIPTPSPEMRRPMKSAYKLPEADKAEPTMKKSELNNKVMRLPYCWDGPLAIKLPIQAPRMVREVATCASTKLG